MTRRDKLRRAILQPINTAGIGILGIVSFFWGAWMACPWFSVFHGNPNYTVMSQLGPEWAWGLAGIVVGAMILFGVIKQSHRALLTGATTAYYFWFLITALHLLANWRGEIWVFTLMSALYAIFISLNLKVNKKIIKERI